MAGAGSTGPSNAVHSNRGNRQEVRQDGKGARMISQNNWTRVTAIENVPLLEGRSVQIGGRDVAIFNLNGRFVTIDNQCPHKGGPLCDGIVSGTTVVCPLHGWRFDLDTRLAIRATLPACLTIFPTRVDDGIVMVDVRAGSRIGRGKVAA